jgi:hypothetical protein
VRDAKTGVTPSVAGATPHPEEWIPERLEVGTLKGLNAKPVAGILPTPRAEGCRRPVRKNQFNPFFRS